MSDSGLGGTSGARPGRALAAQLVVGGPVRVPTPEPKADTPVGRHVGSGSAVSQTERVGEELVELVLEGVMGRPHEEGLGHQEGSHEHIDHDRQKGESDDGADGDEQQLSHETIVAEPRPFGYQEVTRLGPEIPPLGEAANPRSVVRENAAGTPVRLVIVDDHALVREGTSRLLEQEPGLSVVGTAGSAEEAVELFQRLQPDVALVDVSLPGRSGLELARWASGAMPAVRVVILSAYDDIAFVDEALNTGVAGYLLKTASGHELAEAVRAAADGVFVLDSAISRRLARHTGNEQPPPEVALTPREAEVLKLVARGLPNKRIAAELGLGVRTVEGYVSGVLAKLGVASRTEAALYALSHAVPSEDE